MQRIAANSSVVIGRATLSGEIERGLKKSESIGKMCQCKTTHQSQWNRRSNFAPIRCVAQEAKWEGATFSSMTENGNGIGVRSVERRLAPDEEPCSKAYASQWRSLSSW